MHMCALFCHNEQIRNVSAVAVQFIPLLFSTQYSITAPKSQILIFLGTMEKFSSFWGTSQSLQPNSRIQNQPYIFTKYEVGHNFDQTNRIFGLTLTDSLHVISLLCIHVHSFTLSANQNNYKACTNYKEIMQTREIWKMSMSCIKEIKTKNRNMQATIKLVTQLFLAHDASPILKPQLNKRNMENVNVMHKINKNKINGNMQIIIKIITQLYLAHDISPDLLNNNFKRSELLLIIFAYTYRNQPIDFTSTNFMCRLLCSSPKWVTIVKTIVGTAC